MITLRSFFDELFVFGQLLLVGEGDTIETLERIVVGITQKVGGRVLYIYITKVSFLTLFALCFEGLPWWRTWPWHDQCGGHEDPYTNRSKDHSDRQWWRYHRGSCRWWYGPCKGYAWTFPGGFPWSFQVAQKVAFPYRSCRRAFQDWHNRFVRQHYRTALSMSMEAGPRWSVSTLTDPWDPFRSRNLLQEGDQYRDGSHNDVHRLHQAYAH